MFCSGPAAAADDYESLRARISVANSGGGAITLSGNIVLSAALPPITGSVAIDGGGHSISGNDAYRIFDVNGGALTLSNLTLTGGNATDDEGGAIRMRNGADVTIERSTVSANRATHGGAIATSSSGDRLTIRDSSFTGNIAEKSAGAISAKGGAIRLMNGARISIEHSTFSENSATYGGAVSTASKDVRLSVTGSSFSSNRASWSGGAIGASWLGGGRIFVSGSSFVKNSSGYSAVVAVDNPFTRLKIDNSSFINNSVSAMRVENGATATLTHLTIKNYTTYPLRMREDSFATAGRVSLRNSIVVGNLSDEICANVKQNIGNLIKDGSCSPMLSGDPMLAEAIDSSAYLAPLPGSPAINAADPRFCPDTDQLGRARSIFGRCDIGAIEAVPVSRTLSDCAVTTTHLLNFRDGPGGSIIGGVPQNATLPVIARTPRWYKVEHDGQTGWISADYVAVQGDCD